MNRIHFIAIGGSIMHSLAIALKEMGKEVTGSDDEIFEPSRSRLDKHGLLPENGWHTDRISKDIDAVILGMHAKVDNPELVKARELGVPIYSFPEYLYEECKDKQRIAIAGSHGKTSITAMIMHVLKFHHRNFDYVVGSALKGFENQVKLTTDAPIVILEGDEYMTSPLDNTPKFLKYHHHIAVISGIAWDHINVFPSKEQYNHQFERLIDATDRSGTIIFNEDDLLLASLCHKDILDVNFSPYSLHPHHIKNGQTYLKTDDGDIETRIFGKHNLYNLNAAKSVCERIGVTGKMFYDAVKSFEGASNRLEKVKEGDYSVVYKDFAHAPSKLKATVAAMKDQFPERRLTACIELHTFSSLNKEFISEYNHTLEDADESIVFVNPKAIEHKGLDPITRNEIVEAFGNNSINFIQDTEELKEMLTNKNWDNHNLIMMSSGDFGGLDVQKLAEELIH